MLNLIILVIVSLVLLTGIYLAVKKENKLTRIAALCFGVLILSQIALTTYFTMII